MAPSFATHDFWWEILYAKNWWGIILLLLLRMIFLCLYFFSYSTTVCLGVDFLCVSLFCLGFIQLLEYIDLCLLKNLEVFSHYFFVCSLISLIFLSLFGTPVTWMVGLLLQFQESLRCSLSLSVSISLLFFPHSAVELIHWVFLFVCFGYYILQLYKFHFLFLYIFYFGLILSCWGFTYIFYMFKAC